MHDYLLPALEKSPDAIAAIVRRIASARLGVPTGEGRFSPKEVVAHLADWEPIFLSRMQTAESNPGSTVEVYDEGVRAVSQGYAGSDVEEQLRAFRNARDRTVAWLRSLSVESWSKSVEHPERGRMTIEDIANMLVGHDMYHVEQLARLLDADTVGTW
ncbi:MAG: DinB family protein [Fimbriimonadaceae bacterium]